MSENKTPEVIYVYQSYLIANATIGSFTTNNENSYGEIEPYILKSKYDELLKIGANERILWQLNNLNNNLRTLQSKYDLLLKEKEELEKAYEEYNKLLLDECSELVGMATVHGWKSTRVEQGIKCRDKIAELKYKPTEK